MNILERLKSIKESLWLPQIKQAIDTNTYLFINYNGDENNAKGRRMVAPYVVGNLKGTGNMAIRAYQQLGDSEEPQDIPDWRLFLVDNIASLHNTNNNFDLRSDYKPDDKGFMSISHKIDKRKKPITTKKQGKSLLDAFLDLIKK